MPTRKVAAAAITGLVVYAVTKLGLQVEPAIEQAINVMAMLAAAYIVPEDRVPPVATMEGRGKR